MRNNILRPSFLSSVFLVAWLAANGVLQAEIIPSTRLISWSRNTVGVPGGIPNRTTIFTNFSPGATAKQISAALKSCPTNQVVFLREGTYYLTNSIIFEKSFVSLRGAGMGKTILVGAITNSGAIILCSQSPKATAVAVTNGFTRGSTSVRLASIAKGMQVGTIVKFSQLNEPNLVWTRFPQPRALVMYGMVTRTNLNSIEFTPPLAYVGPGNVSPQCEFLLYKPISFIGLEDLTLTTASVNTTAYNLWFADSYGCWLRNVESSEADNIHFCFASSLRAEVRGCYVHDTTSANDGYGLELIKECTGFLVEDNVFNRCWAGLVVNQTVGSVFAYNLITNCLPGVFRHQGGGANCNHGAHGAMNLWEGNVSEQFQNDGYHGSTSHQTLFRNWFHGLHSTYDSNRKMVDLCRFSYFHNVVGNVLGHSSWQPNYYSITNRGYGYTISTIYRLGYPNMGDNSYSLLNSPTNAADGGKDPRVEATLLRHGNYDTFSKTTVWNSTIPDRVLPPSLYLTAKPSWFGAAQWPPFGPDLSPMVSPIPAQIWFGEKFGDDALTPRRLRQAGSAP